MIPVTYITSDSNVPQYVWFNHTADEGNTIIELFPLPDSYAIVVCNFSDSS